MYKLALTELWNKNNYGYCTDSIRPDGHYISPFEALDLGVSNIDKLNNMSILKQNLQLNLVKLYTMGDYTLCIICTPHIKILQRVWRKKYRKIKDKINKYKNIKCLYNRELYGI